MLYQQNHRDSKKIIVTTTKCLVLLTKRLVAAAKFLVSVTKTLFVVPNFVSVTKPFFPLNFVGDFVFVAFLRVAWKDELVLRGAA